MLDKENKKFDLKNHEKLETFARKFLKNQKSAPPEFEETFRKNYWKLLKESNHV